MKKRISVCLLALSVLPITAQNISKFAGIYNAGNYAYGNPGGPQPLRIDVGNDGIGTQGVKVAVGNVTLSDGTIIAPLAVGTPIVVGSGASAETISPIAVVCNTPYIPASCGFTAVFAFIHGPGDLVRSASQGLQEALNAASVRGGAVIVDGAWAAAGGTSGMISAATVPANTAISDNRNGQALAGGGGGGGGNVSTGGLLASGNVITGASVHNVQDSGVAFSTVTTAGNTQTLTGKSIDAAQLTGTIPAARMPALSGDISSTAGSTSTTLATVNGAPGACGDAGHVCAVTSDGKGRVLSQAAVAISGVAGGVATPLFSGLPKATNASNTLALATPGTDYQSAISLSAKDAGNGTTTGIAGQITACGTSISCSIIVPPSYATTEAVPGQSNNFNGGPPGTGSTSGNILIQDLRFGDWRTQINPRGNPFGNNFLANNWNFNYTTSAPGVAANLFGMSLVLNAIDGGTNSNTAFGNKTNYSPFSVALNSYTPGQHIGISNSMRSYSVGDTLVRSGGAFCFGGYSAATDEGCEAEDMQLFMGGVAFAGALTGSPTTGATSVTVNPTQGAWTQGAGRFLLNTTSGKTITAGTISAVASVDGSLTTLTGAGTPWAVSTVVGTLGSAVSAPGVVTVTPTFSTGTIAGITTSSKVCVGDGEQFEQVQPSAVTGSTFTATFLDGHPSTAVISVGGLCGYALALSADNVTNSTYTGNVQQITGTLRRAWPVMYSTSSTGLKLWVAGGGNLKAMPTSWDATTANGYTLYPMATVASVQVAGGVSNTLTLQPNSVAWAASDTVEIPIYPAWQMGHGINVMEQYFPQFGSASAGGPGIDLNGIWEGNSKILPLNNNTKTSFYTMNGGKYTPPYGMVMNGQYSYGLLMNTGPSLAAIAVGCPSNGCVNQFYPVLRASGTAGGTDNIWYDEVNGRWRFTSHFTSKSVLFNDLDGNAGIITGTTTAGHCAVFTANPGELADATCGTGGGGNATSIQGVAVSAVAPTANQTLQLIGGTWTPSNGNFSASQLIDFSPTLSSGTLTENAGASAAAPAIVQVGATTFYRGITSVSSTVTSGTTDTAYHYIDSAGVRTVGTSTAVIACTSCTAVTGVTTWPAGSKPLFSWTITSGAYAVGGYTDYRAFLSVPGAGGAGTTVTAAAPYINIGGTKYVASTMWPYGAFPTCTSLDANTLTATSGATGSKKLVSNQAVGGGGIYCGVTATTSIEQEFSVGSSSVGSPTGTGNYLVGNWIYDSTNAAIYVIGVKFAEEASTSAIDAHPSLWVLQYSYTGSGTPAFVAQVGYQTGVPTKNLHLRIAKSGGTLTASYSDDGGATYTPAYSVAAGTISQAGAYLDGGTTMTILSSVIN